MLCRTQRDAATDVLSPAVTSDRQVQAGANIEDRVLQIGRPEPNPISAKMLLRVGSASHSTLGRPSRESIGQDIKSSMTVLHAASSRHARVCKGHEYVAPFNQPQSFELARAATAPLALLVLEVIDLLVLRG
jgi:hypothetical protein